MVLILTKPIKAVSNVLTDPYFLYFKIIKGDLACLRIKSFCKVISCTILKEEFRFCLFRFAPILFSFHDSFLLMALHNLVSLFTLSSGEVDSHNIHTMSRETLNLVEVTFT